MSNHAEAKGRTGPVFTVAYDLIQDDRPDTSGWSVARQPEARGKILRIGAFEKRALQAVRLAGPRAYAAQLARDIEKTTDRQVSIAQMFQALERLDDKGLIQWRMESQPESGARARRIFRLTGAGAAVLDARPAPNRLHPKDTIHETGYPQPQPA